MERLTEWSDRVKRFVIPQGAYVEASQRLAAYENIGLEPETITRILEAINRQHPDLRWMIEALGRN